MNTTHSTPFATGNVIHIRIALASLADSPFNPRSTYSEPALQELAASITAMGDVMEPLLVRPVAGQDDAWQIVFGHRRKRAAELAGLDSVPCMVRAMTDAEAALAQLHENMQREDMSPLDEADGMARLMREVGLSADEIAAQLGVSRRHVYNRVKLAAMCPEAREALEAGRIGVETANAIARVVGEELQQRALRVALEHASSDGRGYRATVADLNEKFTQRLKGAIFALDDAGLLPDAGACTTCPKRSGNAPELFGDVAEADGRYRGHEPGQPPRVHLSNAGPNVCTDPGCYAAKHKAQLARVAEAAKAEGQSVVTGNAARQTLSAAGVVKGAYVAAADVKKLVDKLPPKERPEAVTIVDQRSGKTIKAFRRDALQGTSVATAAADTHDKKAARSDAQARKAQQEHEQRVKEAAAVYAALREATHATTLGPGGADLFWLRRMVRCLLEYIEYGDDFDLVQQWHGGERAYQLQARTETMTAAELTRLALDCLLVDRYSHYTSRHNPDPQAANDLARHLQVDLDAVLTRLRADQPADEPAETPGPAARAPKKGAKAAPGEAETPAPAARARGKAGAAAPELVPVQAWPFPGDKSAEEQARASQAKLAQAELGLESTLAADAPKPAKKASKTKPAEAGEHATAAAGAKALTE